MTLRATEPSVLPRLAPTVIGRPAPLRPVDVAAVLATLLIPAAVLTASWLYPAELLCFFFLQILGAAVFGCWHVWRRPGWILRCVATVGLIASASVVFAPVVAAERRAGAPVGAGGEGECLTVMTVNVLATNKRAEGLEAEIAARRPDVVILEEASRFWRDRSRRWADFPYRASDQVRLLDIDVLSRRPILGVSRPFVGPRHDPPVRENLRVEIAPPDGAAGPPTVVYALHAETPRSLAKWHQRNALLEAVAPVIAREAPETPVVVGGDFNTPLWSPALGRFAETAGLAHLGTGAIPLSTRFLLPPIPLLSGAPIDHLLVNDAFEPATAVIGNAFGSDHLPVTARICRRPAVSASG